MDAIFDALTTYYQAEKLNSRASRAHWSEAPMTVHTALLQGARLLEDAGIAVPRLTAEVLLAHAIRKERVHLYAHPEQELQDVEWLHYGRYLHERLNRKPTQYITGRQEFYGVSFG